MTIKEENEDDCPKLLDEFSQTERVLVTWRFLSVTEKKMYVNGCIDFYLFLVNKGIIHD